MGADLRPLRAEDLLELFLLFVVADPLDDFDGEEDERFLLLANFLLLADFLPLDETFLCVRRDFEELFDLVFDAFFDEEDLRSFATLRDEADDDDAALPVSPRLFVFAFFTGRINRGSVGRTSTKKSKISESV